VRLDPLGWDLEIERETLAIACRDSFWLFLKYAFGVARNPRGRWLTEEVHRPIAELLQREGLAWLERRRKQEQGRTKVMCVIPRGFGKTVIVTKAFPLWLHLHDPDLACVVDSESAQKAVEFVSSIKVLLEGGDPYSLFAQTYGVWHDPARLWTNAQFTHALRRQMALTEPSFDTASVETGTTGSHPDLLVLDDPISQEKIRERGNWIQLSIQHTNALIPALRTDSFFLYVGTPYTNADVISMLLRTDGIREAHGMKLPPTFPEPSPDGEWVLYYLQARDARGESILPRAWTKRELDLYEKKKPQDFAAQMMCAPGTGKHMPLTAEQIDLMWIDRKDLARHMHYTIHLDTAFKDMKRKSAGDESVILVFGHDVGGRTGDVYYIEGHGSNEWQIDEFCHKLVTIVQRYRSQLRRIRAVTDEIALGGKQGLWETHLRSRFADAGLYMPQFIQLQRSGTRKHVRITEAAGYWAEGHMKLVRGASGVDNLVRQMLEIGVSAHDDWADAAADAFHPDIYRPMIPLGEEAGIDAPRRPFDQYLLTGKITDEVARDAYDTLVEEETRWVAIEP